MGENTQEHYTVKGGDTVSQIAARHGVSLTQFLEANPDLDDPNKISIGQQLNVPSTVSAVVQPETKTPQTNTVYSVNPGDTFSQIAQEHGLKTHELEAANPDIEDIGRINVGQLLHIPQKAPKADLKSAITHSYNIDPRAVENAWRKMDGKDVTDQFTIAGKDNRPLIVIDPGHAARSQSGVLDPGAVGEYESVVTIETPDGVVKPLLLPLSEVDVVDPVAQALATRLSDAGYRVAFTRNPGEEFRYGAADQQGRLASRSHFAHVLEDQLDAPYTVFVSVHANAAANPDAQGMQVFIDNAESGRDGPASSRHSQALGESIMGNMDGYKGLNNRGVATYNASVLDTMERQDSTPGQPDAAALIELGFLTNEDDIKVLDEMSRDPDGIADRIAHGIHEYIHSRAPQNEYTAEAVPTLKPGPQG